MCSIRKWNRLAWSGLLVMQWVDNISAFRSDNVEQQDQLIGNRKKTFYRVHIVFYYLKYTCFTQCDGAEYGIEKNKVLWLTIVEPL